MTNSLSPEGPLVTTQWLANHLSDPRVVVVDCRWYLPPMDLRDGPTEYAVTHIPGATHLGWDSDIADPDRPDLWMLAAPRRYAEAMGTRGIGDDTFVVAYDDQQVTVAARLWWSLRVYGHDRVAVLDGGFDKWNAEDRPVTAELPSPTAVTFTPRFRPELYGTKSQVLAAVNDPSVTLVDGRMTAARLEDGGAIPNSHHAAGIEFITTEGVWPSPDACRTRIEQAGANVEADTIAYCRGGVGACGTTLAYALAGNDRVAMYDGSWTEWITDPDTPRDLDKPA